jgi:hypothetical protein
MKSAVRQIDRALKRLYNLESQYRAEDFLLSRPVSSQSKVGNADLRGALYVRGEAQELSLGIYLSEAVTHHLSTFKAWRHRKWSRDQIGAFTVATEEISHFHYLLFHATNSRQVTQLELELQGEIDKFLLTYFATRHLSEDFPTVFEALFEQIFYRFHLADHLSAEEKTRYTDANSLARRFIRKQVRWLTGKDPHHEKSLGNLRRFYRVGAGEKISLIG